MSPKKRTTQRLNLNIYTGCPAAASPRAPCHHGWFHQEWEPHPETCCQVHPKKKKDPKWLPVTTPGLRVKRTCLGWYCSWNRTAWYPKRPKSRLDMFQHLSNLCRNLSISTYWLQEWTSNANPPIYGLRNPLTVGSQSKWNHISKTVWGGCKMMAYTNGIWNILKALVGVGLFVPVGTNVDQDIPTSLSA